MLAKTRRLLGRKGLAVAGLLAAGAFGAYAMLQNEPLEAALGKDPFSALVAMPDPELATLRGGMISAGGVQFDLGLVVNFVAGNSMGEEINVSVTYALSPTQGWQATSNSISGSDVANTMVDIDDNLLSVNRLDGAQRATYDLSSGILASVQNTLESQAIVSELQLNTTIFNSANLARSSQLRRTIGNIGPQVTGAVGFGR